MQFINSFIEDYLREFAEVAQDIENIFKQSFEDLCLTIDCRYADFLKSMDRLKQFNQADKSSDEFNAELARIEHQIQTFALNYQVTQERFEPLQKKANDLLRFFQSGVESINRQVEAVYNELIASPQGRLEDGLPFQQLVLDFIDAVFIHEFVRDDFPKTRCKGINMDGLYNKLDSFNSRERTGFGFQKVLVECKNKKPDVNDLMQCFKYTLCYQTSEISQMPLVLLICRTKPGRNSSIWEINRKIFDKQVTNETRLILILTLEDLGEMKRLKLSGLDPVKVIKDKIAEFS